MKKKVLRPCLLLLDAQMESWLSVAVLDVVAGVCTSVPGVEDSVVAGIAALPESVPVALSWEAAVVGMRK